MPKLTRVVSFAAAGGKEHDYHYCADPACPRFPCRVFKEGQGEGYWKGFMDGEAVGYATGYSAGVAAGARV